MKKKYGENFNRHVPRSIVTEADLGFREISNDVENADNRLTNDDADGDDADDSKILEEYDNYEENAINRRGMGTVQARNYARTQTASRYGIPAVNRALLNRMNGLGQTNTDTISNNTIDESLSFLITRTSYNIPNVRLPFVFGSPVSLQEQYRGILGQIGTIPNTVNLVSVLPDANGDLVFKYADKATGLLIDNVIISSNGDVRYVTMLEMEKSDFWKAKGWKYTAEQNYTAQFNASRLYGGKQTLFGVQVGRSYPFSIFKTVSQFQLDMINVNITYRADKESWLAGGMAATPPSGATTSTIAWDFFVTEYFRKTYGNTLGKR